ncbi:hypothetical protein ACFWMJ_34720 [Streptomyces hawaiiensis]|uniref:hypothetical protein n=1 Tax=Streptomyces hawaiiensis TaxID=67305 RepID=UPI0036556CFC
MTATLFLLLTLAQGLLAGLFTTGDVDLIAVHGAVGQALPVIALVQLVVALLERRVRRRAGCPATLRLPVLFLLIMLIMLVQIVLGFSRVVAPHMFLGVTTAALGMFALLLVLTDDRPSPAAVPADAEDAR